MKKKGFRPKIDKKNVDRKTEYEHKQAKDWSLNEQSTNIKINGVLLPLNGTIFY